MWTEHIVQKFVQKTQRSVAKGIAVGSKPLYSTRAQTRVLLAVWNGDSGLGTDRIMFCLNFADFEQLENALTRWLVRACRFRRVVLVAPQGTSLEDIAPNSVSANFQPFTVDVFFCARPAWRSVWSNSFMMSALWLACAPVFSNACIYFQWIRMHFWSLATVTRLFTLAIMKR
jgi:hypothetical protein